MPAKMMRLAYGLEKKARLIVIACGRHRHDRSTLPQALQQTLRLFRPIRAEQRAHEILFDAVATSLDNREGRALRSLTTH